MEEAKLLRITHKGKLDIGQDGIPCAVLEDGTRVLSETGVTNAILHSRSGASKKKKSIQKGGAPLPVFLAPETLKPFISDDLRVGAHSITYLDGKRIVHGYNAVVLPSVCDVWLKAREAGALLPSQLDKAQNAEVLMRALAKVGIIALIDEATGYQEDRERNELARLLKFFVAEELVPWAKTFPDEFYLEMFKLMGWTYKGNPKSAYVGKLTNFLIYDRLPSAVVEELKKKNPKDANGRRKYKLFQWLTANNGQPMLKTQVSTSITMMRAFNTWDEFEPIYRRAYSIVEPLESEQQVMAEVEALEKHEMPKNS